MNRFIRTLALVMFLSICNLAPMPALATTYDISFLGEGGSTLTGSITTSVTSGAVVQSDIVAWSFSSSLGGGFVLSSTDPGSIFFQSPSELTVSGTSLLFAPSPGVSTFNRFSSGLSSVVFQAAQGRGGMVFPPQVVWSTQQGILDPISIGDSFWSVAPIVVGIARTTPPIPEPSTVFLMGIGLAAAFGVACIRSRQLKIAATV